MSLTDRLQAFLPTIPVDASSFGLWLHQSLPAFTQDVEQTSEGLEYLCAADVMRTDDDIVGAKTGTTPDFAVAIKYTSDLLRAAPDRPWCTDVPTVPCAEVRRISEMMRHKLTEQGWT